SKFQCSQTPPGVLPETSMYLASRWSIPDHSAFSRARNERSIRERFGWEAVGYASVVLGISHSIPDEFRELAEKEL
ncbi:MAG: hypothetical protein ABWZ93_14780, partial [Xanthobacteraceae bacterium]